MTDEILNELAVWPIYGVVLASHVLVLVYGLGSSWWRSLLGVSIFAKWLSIALVFDFIIARRALGDFPGYGWLALAAYSFMFLAFWAVVVEIAIERRHPADDIAHRKAPPMSNTPITTATVPPIWYKAQRVLRTVFTTVITVLPLIPQVIAIIQGQWDATWLTAVAAQAVAINAALTALIALPAVNAFLTRFGLGSVPRSAIINGEV